VDLLLGSEGALGIVTDATFRIRPLPKASDYRGFLFRDFASGTAAIRRAVQEEIPVAMLRLSDSDETAFFRAYAEIGKKKTFAQRIGEFYYDMRGIETNGCLLIAGFEGTASRVEAARRAFSDIAHQLGALDLGRRPGERWRASRFHGPYMRDPMLDRGVGVDTLETAANWAMLGALHVSVRGAIENAIRETAPHPAARGVVMCHISHSYTEGASLYFTYIFPRALDREIAQWQAIKNAATEAILANGGTISHHHGVGEDHLPWIAQEKGELGIDILRAIKRTVDPKGILNPGKLLPS
jgi:alkyldihydroxyacetonephosphate synthase